MLPGIPTKGNGFYGTDSLKWTRHSSINAILLWSIFGSSHVSSLWIICVVLPRSLAATSTLASRFSIALSWHFIVITRGMLVRQAANMSAIRLDNRPNNCSSLICSMSFWYFSMIDFAMWYMGLATIYLLGGWFSACSWSVLLLISETICSPLSANQLRISMDVFRSKANFPKGSPTTGICHEPHTTRSWLPF